MNQPLKRDNLREEMAGPAVAVARERRPRKKEARSRCSPDLVEILLMLAHPAWVETADGRILYYNKVRLAGEEVDPLLMADISRRTPTGGMVENHPGAQCDPAPFSAVAFPVMCATAGNLRIVVACPAGEERARDQELTLALWGKLLKTETDIVFDPRLTAQQRQVFRLLRRRLTYKEMAAALGVAHSTIRVQVASVRRLLGKEKVPVLRR
ncbi:MAG: hypothetical protein RLZZ50_1438 [Verrucomicrobiota bacterium]|jgi:hypothetical protein